MFNEAREEGKHAVIESIRSIGEARFLKEHGAIILAVDADEKIRFDRITKRGSETDHVNFEEFKEQETQEMAQKEAHRMNVRGVMELADIVVENNGTIEDLHVRLGTALKELLAK